MKAGEQAYQGWVVIKDKMASAKDANMARRWGEFLYRHEMYTSIDVTSGLEKYLEFKDWPNRPAFRKRINKINNGLSALREIDGMDVESLPNKSQIEDVITQKINIAQSEFELAQLELLQKIQHIKRPETDQLEKDIIAARKKYNADLAALTNIPAANLAPFTNKFIHHEKNKFHFSEKISLSEKIANALGVGSRGWHMIVILVHGLKALGAALSIFPIISAIVSAVPMVFEAARTWLKNKSTTKKVFALALAVLAVAILINVGLGTVATGGMVAGLITLGVIKNQMLPWKKMRDAIKEKQTVIDEITDRQRQVNDAPIQQLNVSEKQMLLNALEKRYLEVAPSNKDDILRSIGLVTKGETSSIRDDKNVLNVLGGKSLETYISDNNKVRLNELNKDLRSMKEKQKDLRIGMFNGLLAIAGAILVCIPTPPTLILGASLLVVNSVVGLALHFGLPAKIRNFFRRGSKEEPVKEAAANDNIEKEQERLSNHLDNREEKTHQAAMHPRESTAEVLDHLNIPATVVANNLKSEKFPTNDAKLVQNDLVFGAPSAESPAVERNSIAENTKGNSPKVS